MSQEKCGIVRLWSGKKIFRWKVPKIQKKNVYPSRYASIPGELFNWLRQNAGKEGRGEELEQMIKHC